MATGITDVAQSRRNHRRRHAGCGEPLGAAAGSPRACRTTMAASPEASRKLTSRDDCSALATYPGRFYSKKTKVQRASHRVFTRVGVQLTPTLCNINGASHLRAPTDATLCLLEASVLAVLPLILSRRDCALATQVRPIRLRPDDVRILGLGTDQIGEADHAVRPALEARAVRRLPTVWIPVCRAASPSRETGMSAHHRYDHHRYECSKIWSSQIWLSQIWSSQMWLRLSQISSSQKIMVAVITDMVITYMVAGRQLWRASRALRPLHARSPRHHGTAMLMHPPHWQGPFSPARGRFVYLRVESSVAAQGASKHMYPRQFKRLA